jgi:5-methylcytosine-specific restriction enzyme subunit McrC
VKRGIRNDYVRVSQQEKFLRGRLNVSKQLRQSPAQQHIFNVEYDKFIAERAENRLIRAALAKVLVWSKDHKNQRDGRELLFHFDSVTPSTNYREDFLQWRSSRDMIYYAPTKPWCQLILSEQSPFFSAGKWKGPSLLFPMEKLFESYIAKKISPKLGYDFTMTEQAQGKYLVKHESSQWFKLMPDMLITQYGKPYIVLDAKWKLLNDRNGDASKQYGLSQSDVYQLFAYGQKYLQGIGEMYLIYPANERFKVPLSPFDFSDDLRLWVVPFDLDNDQLMLRQDCHLPETFKEFEYLKSA